MAEGSRWPSLAALHTCWAQTAICPEPAQDAEQQGVHSTPEERKRLSVETEDIQTRDYKKQVFKMPWCAASRAGVA